MAAQAGIAFRGEAHGGSLRRALPVVPNLEEWAGETFRVVLPQFPIAHGADRREAMKLAEAVRNALELGNHPRHASASTGRLRRCKGGSSSPWPGRNAASAVGEFGMAVLLNSDNGPRQRTFDLARPALYHLVTWRSRGQSNTPEAAEELTASRFAARLLVPFNSLAEAMESIPPKGRIGLTDLAVLARRFEGPDGSHRAGHGRPLHDRDVRHGRKPSSRMQEAGLRQRIQRHASGKTASVP